MFTFKIGGKFEFKLKLVGLRSLKKNLGSPCYWSTISGVVILFRVVLVKQEGVFFGAYRFPAIHFFCLTLSFGVKLNFLKYPNNYTGILI